MNAYLLLLFLLPLPFGSNSDWAWSFFAIITFILLGKELLQAHKLQHAAQLDTIQWPMALRKGLPILLALLLVQSWVGIQVLFMSFSPHDTYLYFLQGLALSAFFALSLLLLTTRERIKSALWAIILAAGLQAIYGSLMVLSGLEFGFFTAKTAYVGKATGTFINRNHLAGYLEMSIAVGIGFLLASQRSYRGNAKQKIRQSIETLLSSKIWMRLLLAIMVIALVLTHSRMGNTAFFASLMITGAVALLLMRNKSRSTIILLSSLLIIDIAIVGTFFGVEKVADRLQNSSVEKESRDEVSRDSFYMWLDNSATGIGAGSYQATYPVYKSADVTSAKVYDHAHNDYLQFLAELGLPAFLILLFAVLLCFYWAIYAVKKRRSRLFQGLGFSATMGLLAIGIHSTVDFNLQIPANAFMFVFLMALAVIARWGERR